MAVLLPDQGSLSSHLPDNGVAAGAAEGARCTQSFTTRPIRHLELSIIICVVLYLHARARIRFTASFEKAPKPASLSTRI